jgi:hypothetical protein
MFGRILAGMNAVEEIRRAFPLLVRKLENPRVYASFSLVLLFHAALIWVLASGLALPSGPQGIERETQVALIASAPTSQPKLDPIPETRVAKSSGMALLDQLAQSFAKTNWRFRAATANGAAVPDWTTVLVRFVPTR